MRSRDARPFGMPVNAIELQRPSSAAHPGTGALGFERRGARTVVSRAYATSPLRLLMPRNRGDAAWVYTSSFGGGLVGGDRCRLVAAVGPGAKAVLSTQASTKVYRSARPAAQEVDASVAEGGLLAMLPDPVACFAGADFSQEQRYDLAPGANLVVADGLTSGRWAAGERWQFARVLNRIEIRREGRAILRESLLLDPADGPLAERMGRFNALLLAVVCGPALAPAAARLLEDVSAQGLRTRPDVLAAASPLPDGDGVLLRLAAVSVEEGMRRLRALLAFLVPMLADDPWARKW